MYTFLVGKVLERHAGLANPHWQGKVTTMKLNKDPLEDFIILICFRQRVL